ncbi:hypothetical protein OS493_018352 [Desmophyllum pertusum]|uniref:Cilia- and flagella-associated protein HOATZ n=1 Tax=Desmophyllum pertusum TaxID=174260 RepID=A0A9X0CG85_9CNID|nr:hypothetical protein OS493_018352 [Desmophyllum pertusum]
MADLSTVTFSGSSAETIENAKAFWKSIDPPPEPTSRLVVSGINHRLITAPKVQNGKKLNGDINDTQRDFFERKTTQDLRNIWKMHRIGKNRNKQIMYKEWEEAQETLAQRKAERLKKEELSHRQPRDPVFNISESSDEDEEVAEAMAEIDKFEQTLKQREAIKPQ